MANMKVCVWYEGFAGNVNENEMENDYFSKNGTTRAAVRSDGDGGSGKCNGHSVVQYRKALIRANP